MSKRRASYEDLAKLPDHLVGEIIEGELIVSPRPASRHANASSVMGGALNGAFHRPPGGSGGPGDWWILFEPELHLHGDVIVPDLAGWRRERLPRLPNTAAFKLAPDWACEVISPRSGRLDRIKKMRIYAREGVGHLWLVEPTERTIEAYRLEADRWIVVGTYGGDERARIEPFAAFELELERMWLPDEEGEEPPAP